MDVIRDAVIIGTGNVAAHLGGALVKSGVPVRQVYGRNLSAAASLAAALDAQPINMPLQITGDASIYILALSDSAYVPFLQSADLRGKLLVHTAGSIPVSIFAPYTGRYGCLYPLQTFSRSRPLEFRGVTVFVEGSNPATAHLLFTLASRITDHPVMADSERRQKIHLAAVIACNFVNHLMTIAADLLGKEGITFDVLSPLIRETCSKAIDLSPVNAQTGPAFRHDWNVVEKHLELLKSCPEWQQIYDILSRSIATRHPVKHQNPETS